jgi:hypothetical protein
MCSLSAIRDFLIVDLKKQSVFVKVCFYTPENYTGNASNAQTSVQWQCHAENTHFCVDFPIQTWVKFAKDCEGSDRFSIGSTVNNVKCVHKKIQRRPMKYHFGYRWHINSLVRTVSANSKGWLGKRGGPPSSSLGCPYICRNSGSSGL